MHNQWYFISYNMECLCFVQLTNIFRNIFYLFLFERDVPMTPYHHLCSQHCNASWRGQFMNIAQLAPRTTFNTQWVWRRGGSRPSRVEIFPRSHPETTFQVYKHLDLTGKRTPVAWTEIQSANHYTTDPFATLIVASVIGRRLVTGPFVFPGFCIAVIIPCVSSFGYSHEFAD